MRLRALFFGAAPRRAVSCALGLVLALAASACAKRQLAGPRLGMPEVKAGMKALSDDFHDCYERHKVGGYAQATIRIERDGRVSKVTLGKLAGTPTGNCVIAVVKRARFRPFKDDPIVIQYPILLR